MQTDIRSLSEQKQSKSNPTRSPISPARCPVVPGCFGSCRLASQQFEYEKQRLSGRGVAADTSADEVRSLLLPGTDKITMDSEPAPTPPPEAVAKELASAAAAVGLSVDTGSSLTSSDWLDIDSKDLVARAKVRLSPRGPPFLPYGTSNA